MYLSPKKSAFTLMLAISVLTTFMIVQWSGTMDMAKLNTKSLLPLKKKYTIRQWLQFTPKEKESKWKRCRRLISGEEKVERTYIRRNDSKIFQLYQPDEDCDHVLHTRFAHPYATKEETKLPIAYGFTVYKGASLFERILQAIYMPHNVYCIHIDKKSPEVFYRAIQAIIRCLPNVFIASKRVDVVWGHISLVQAQLECMRELLESTVKWKYYISLIGQDFPLYENKEIVRALRMLNNTNSMESEPMPKHNEQRTKNVFILKDREIQMTETTKPPPPHNVSIYKGSTHIVAVREFVRFVLYSKIGKDFIEFLEDTYIPDETVYSSLQQHKVAPGGILGEQPEHIARALHWTVHEVCYGKWIRSLCWLSIKDLQWTLGRDMKNKLFVHKIPFDFNDDLLECLLVARQERTYGFDVWNTNKMVSQKND